MSRPHAPGCPAAPDYLLAVGEACPMGCTPPLTLADRVASLERAVADIAAFVGAMPDADRALAEVEAWRRSLRDRGILR